MIFLVVHHYHQSSITSIQGLQINDIHEKTPIQRRLDIYHTDTDIDKGIGNETTLLKM